VAFSAHLAYDADEGGSVFEQDSQRRSEATHDERSSIA
jgi:hypothetical protein